jgi:predicted RNase H-like HicB family nuclease
MLTETKQKPLFGGGAATWVEASPPPFTATQGTVWAQGTMAYQVGVVLHPRIPSLHADSVRKRPRTLTAVYQQSGEWWAAWAEELPGANTQGHTLEEARENLREAVQLMLEEGEVPEESHEPLAPGAIREPLTVVA